MPGWGLCGQTFGLAFGGFQKLRKPVIILAQCKFPKGIN